MEKPLDILYVGSLNPRGTCCHRKIALEDMGHRVVGLHASLGGEAGLLLGLLNRLGRRLFNSVHDRRFNEAIWKAVRGGRFDILWIDKGLSVAPRTLRLVREHSPGTRIVGYCPDDVMTRGNQSRQFLRGLPLYDAYLTTKSFHVTELRDLGCPKVVFVPNAYAPHVHRPISVPAQERARLGGPVGFIGGAERQRARSVACLADNGIPVKVWGDLWDRWKKRLDGKFEVAGPSRYGDEYVRIICSFDINLCFLRKANRDLQTTRSVEIPACEAFMLAERTDEHLGLFREGIEAEFFACDEELLEKVRYYLAHPLERQRIARAGRERCLKSGYSNSDRLRHCLEAILQQA